MQFREQWDILRALGRCCIPIKNGFYAVQRFSMIDRIAKLIIIDSQRQCGYLFALLIDHPGWHSLINLRSELFRSIN